MIRCIVSAVAFGLVLALSFPALAQQTKIESRGLQGLKITFLPGDVQRQIRVALQEEIEDAVTQAAAAAEQRLQEQAAEQLAAANTMNRVVDTVGGYADRIDELTPTVWRASIRQQYTEAISLIILGVIVLIVSLVVSDYYFRGNNLFMGGVVLATVVACLVLVTLGVCMLINPEYYAMHDVAHLLHGG